MAYATIEQIEDYLLIDIDAGFESSVDGFIAQAESIINSYTNRNFTPPAENAEATSKLYDGDGSDCLFIDDAISIASVSINGTELDSDSYYLYPANKLPKTKIVLDGSVFTRGKQNIEVEAIWGYKEEVPADIQFATIVLVGSMIRSSFKQEGDVQSETIGRYSVTYQSNKELKDIERTKDILNLYRKVIF